MELLTGIAVIVVSAGAVMIALAGIAHWAMRSGESSPDAEHEAASSVFIDPVPGLVEREPAKPGRPITIASYAEVWEVQLNRLLLEGHGIPAFVADAGMVGTDWFYSNAIGGVKLQVPEPYAAEAQQLLGGEATNAAPRELPNEPPAAGESGAARKAPPCPICRSHEVYRVRRRRKWAFGSLLVLSFPIPVTGVGYECDRCGHRWAGEPT